MNKKHKSMIAPILITVVMTLYYIAYCGLLISLVNVGWKYLVRIIPILLSLVMISSCIERIKEIKKGEEDDLSKY